MRLKRMIVCILMMFALSIPIVQPINNPVQVSAAKVVKTIKSQEVRILGNKICKLKKNKATLKKCQKVLGAKGKVVDEWYEKIGNKKCKCVKRRWLYAIEGKKENDPFGGYVVMLYFIKNRVVMFSFNETNLMDY